MSFKSKVVVVTGSSGGIGAAIAIAFAKEGADVVVIGRNDEKLKSVKKQCESYGRTPLVLKADVSKDEDAKKIIADTIKKFGKLDILVNNAGILRMSSFVEGTFMSSYEEVHNTNLRAAALLLQLATPHLIASKGNVINISSVAGRQLVNYQGTAYGMSKAAMDMLTSGAALELGKYGVRVNTVSPGPVKTDIITNSVKEGEVAEEITVKTVLNRWSEPEEIADLVLFIASDKAKGITGSNFTSDNGYLVVK
ncbi:glucose 1-dehydrogenase 2-like [Colias croceus]|uniref:glucose 1-dehydrogenase 2-like n=1 Tax=Colias crocea TaxID=72248 RepID=UPI001E27C8BF|nr:glucose 1-dehydrogenase 2-like [Colias croceus]